MKFEFKKIDQDGFARIWNSDFQDAHADSHQKSFEETPENDWKPIFERHLKVMHEVHVNGELIGYIFLSPKDDGNAHLGYGVYSEHRGKGLSVKMCDEFLSRELPNLSKEIVRILGTTLKENIVSQKVLERLGFTFLENLDDPEFDYIRFYKDRNA